MTNWQAAAIFARFSVDVPCLLPPSRLYRTKDILPTS